MIIKNILIICIIFTNFLFADRWEELTGYESTVQLNIDDIDLNNIHLIYGDQNEFHYHTKFGVSFTVDPEVNIGGEDNNVYWYNISINYKTPKEPYKTRWNSSQNNWDFLHVDNSKFSTEHYVTILSGEYGTIHNGTYPPPNNFHSTFEEEFEIPSINSFLSVPNDGLHEFELVLTEVFYSWDNHKNRYQDRHSRKTFHIKYFMKDYRAKRVYVDTNYPLSETNYIMEYEAYSLNKPMLISEGVDVFNVNNPGEYYDMAEELFDNLRNDYGTDIFILNYGHGGQSMSTSVNDSLNDEWGFRYKNLTEHPTLEQIIYNDPTLVIDDSTGNFIKDTEGNATILQSATEYVSSLHNGQDIILTGISMGGVIARYALAAGESNYREYGVGRLPVSHFLSIDSPQQFATIDYDLLSMLFVDFSSKVIAHDFSDPEASKLVESGGSLYSMATRELLWSNPSYIEGSGKSGDQNHIHESFYERLNGLGKYYDGYPSYCKNIGVAASIFDNNLPAVGEEKWLVINGGLKITGPENFEYNYTADLFDLNIDKRLKLAGSVFPSHFSSFQTEAHSGISFEGIVGFFVDPIKLSFYLNSQIDYDYQPTFIPFVSALDIVPVENLNDSIYYPYSRSIYYCDRINSNGFFRYNYLYQYNSNPPYTPFNFRWMDPLSACTVPRTFELEVECRSRFDQVLYTEETGSAAGRFSHDEIPSDLGPKIISAIFDYYYGTPLLSHTIWKNNANLGFGDLRITNEKVLLIKIDTEVKNLSAISNTVVIENGARLILEDNVKLLLNDNIIFDLKPGSILELGENSQIIVKNSSIFIIDKDAIVNFSDLNKFQSFDDGKIEWR